MRLYLFQSTLLAIACLDLQAEGALEKKHSFQAFINDFHFEDEKLLTIYSVGNDGYKMGQNYTGLAESYFYAMSSTSQTAIVYNQDIASLIFLINQNMRSLSGRAEKSADFVSEILAQLTEALNQLILDSSQNAAMSVLKADYLAIRNIVGSFEKEFPSTLDGKHNKKVEKAIRMANRSLQAFTEDMKVYIHALNGLVFNTADPKQALLSSQETLTQNLRKFAQAVTIATYLTTKKR